jgi:hypothetical protein
LWGIDPDDHRHRHFLLRDGKREDTPGSDRGKFLTAGTSKETQPDSPMAGTNGASPSGPLIAPDQPQGLLRVSSTVGTGFGGRSEATPESVKQSTTPELCAELSHCVRGFDEDCVTTR